MTDPQQRPLSPDRPLPLEALAGAWQLESGMLDIFALRRIDGRPQGRREFLLRLAPGDGLCGGGAADPGVALLAIGSQEARLVAAPDPLPAIDAWVLAVAGLLRDPARGWAEYLASPGEMQVPQGGLLGCQGRQVFWATVLAGEVAGPADSAAGLGGPALPVTAATPLLARARSQLRLCDTAGLGEAALTAALAAHQAMLQRHARALVAARAADRAAQIAGSAAASRVSMAEGLRLLSGLAAAAPLTEAEGDPVWRALVRLGAAVGQRLSDRPAIPAAGLVGPDRLRAYAEASTLRLRPVLLRGRWWRRDNGPLLAWRPGANGGNSEPVVLLPDGGGYRAAGGQRLRRAEAEALEPEAWMPYRSLPAGPVRLADLLRHVLRGLHGEASGLLWLSLIAALLGLAAPIAIGLLAATVIPKSDHIALVTLGGGLFAAALGAAGVELTRGLLLQRIEARLTLDTQAALFDRLLRLPVDFFRRFGSGDLADRVLVMDQVRRSLTGARLSGALAGLVALGNVLVMLACNVKLGLLGVLLALVSGAIGLWLCFPQARAERHHAEHRGRTENMVLETIGGVAKLKVAAATERAFAVWARLYGRQHQAFQAAQRIKTWQAAFLAGFLPLAMAILFLFAAEISEALRQQVALLPSFPGTAPHQPASFGLARWLAFSCAFGQLMAGIAQALHAIGGALAVVPLYARAQPLLAAAPESGQGNQPPSRLSGALEFSRVSFAYADAAVPVLPELSFAVRPGEFVAIVGPSGSGKSTILRLLLGFERPTSGAVLYDGRPLATLDAAAVRRQIGVVLQNGRLQPGSILDNIGGGRPLGLAEAWHAAELAGLAREIRALPMGMYTMLSEAGGTLSGGQRQRVLIARALARRPRLLLLDEATSALDNRTQAVVAEAIAGLGLTRLVVAHRLSTIAMADRILVLDRGRLVQEGGYEALIAAPGLFQAMARRQLL